MRVSAFIRILLIACALSACTGGRSRASQRSVAVEVVLPYEQTAAVPNTGAAMSAPG